MKKIKHKMGKNYKENASEIIGRGTGMNESVMQRIGDL